MCFWRFLALERLMELRVNQREEGELEEEAFRSRAAPAPCLSFLANAHHPAFTRPTFITHALYPDL